MGKINLTPLSMRGQDLDNAQAIRRIESYLYQLNEELRYELTHIDEDNMAANNTTVYTAPSSSGESGEQAVNGQTIDLNDNTLIIQLKARIAELQKGQQTALNGVNNNTKAITDANREISSMKNKLDNLSWSYNRHKHSIEIDASGNLSMGGPTANPTYPNIADTAYVRGLVSAAIHSVTIGPNDIKLDGEPYYSAANKRYSVYVEATCASSQSSYSDTRTVSLPVDATEAYNAGWIDGYNAAAGVSGKSADTVTVPTTTSSQGVTPTMAYTAHARVNDTHYISFPASISLVPGQVFQGAAGNYVYKNSVELKGSASGAVYWD